MTVLENDVIPAHNKYKTFKGVSKGLKRKNQPETTTANIKSSKKQYTNNMLNGYKANDHHRCAGNLTNECPIASLSNTGNTCYLNSVLYSLRFSPSFLHNLHHLVEDLSKLNARLMQNKVKSSSLGRTMGTISGPSTRSTSSKDLLSLGSDIIPKSKVQIVTERLHELFTTLHNIEEGRKHDTNDPYQPVAFLQAVRDANSIFQGNQQQDAHELLVYILEYISETGELLTQQVQNCPELLSENEVATSTTSSNNKVWSVKWMKGNKNKKDGGKKDAINEEETNDTCATDSEDATSTEMQVENGRKKMSYNFIAEHFGGITLRRTTCLECESVTERKEPFYEIPVPIIPVTGMEVSASEIYRRACVTSEKLCETNKYLCEKCIRYNEASREVSFEKLPNIMVLQLKRFCSTSAGVQKENAYMPTPLKLACFCEDCCKQESSHPLHRYELYCVIMHLGGALASGHYISYVRASENHEECARDLSKGNHLSAGSSEKSINIFKLFKPKQNSLMEQHKNGLTTKNHAMTHCKSRTCCSVKMNKNVVENAINYSRRNVTADTWCSSSTTLGGGGGGGDNGGGVGGGTSSANHETTDDMWMECDDESIRSITSQELQELLNFKAGSTSTPYLLFYSKITETVLVDD